jgi:hypothetical protein
MPYDRYAFQEFRQNFTGGAVPQEFSQNPTIQDILVFIKEKYNDLLLEVREDPHLRLESTQIRSIVHNAYALANWSLLLAYKYSNRDVTIATNAHPEEEAPRNTDRPRITGMPSTQENVSIPVYLDNTFGTPSNYIIQSSEQFNEAFQRGLRYIESTDSTVRPPTRRR